MTLWLVRHAQPLVEAGICYGHLDMPANAEATRLCAESLLAALPAGIDVVSSPLQRCEQLAHAIIGLQPDLTYKTDFRLMEMNFGAWEGRPWSDIPAPEFADWMANFHAHVPGQTGESVGSFMARVASAFDEIGRGTDTLWITHAGVIRSANLLASGVRHIEHADQWPTSAPAYGQWCKLEKT